MRMSGKRACRQRTQVQRPPVKNVPGIPHSRSCALSVIALSFKIELIGFLVYGLGIINILILYLIMRKKLRGDKQPKATLLISGKAWILIQVKSMHITTS